MVVLTLLAGHGGLIVGTSVAAVVSWEVATGEVVEDLKVVDVITADLGSEPMVGHMGRTVVVGVVVEVVADVVGQIGLTLAVLVLLFGVSVLVSIVTVGGGFVISFTNNAGVVLCCESVEVDNIPFGNDGFLSGQSKVGQH